MVYSNKVFLALLPLFTQCSAADYGSYASQAFDVLQNSWYNDTSGLWDTMGWWNGANGMTAIADLAAIDSSKTSTATQVFSHTYANAPAYNPKNNVFKIAGNNFVETFYTAPPASVRRRMNKKRRAGVNADDWTNSCYDDNGWWALAWIGAWDITKNSDYMNTAKGIFDQMSGGGPTNCSNGGIIWCSDQDYYVNAIANELYLSVAAHLATRDSDSKYLSTAKSQWEWFKGSGMINGDNTINDGLTQDCKNNGETVWSYNQGVILGALVELDKAAGGGGYIDEAHTLAAASISALTGDNKVLHDTCEPTCAPDATQFKGVYMRNLVALQKASPKDQYKDVIFANADSIWENDRNDAGQLSVDWDGPFESPANASTHSSALDALVAAAALS